MREMLSDTGEEKDSKYDRRGKEHKENEEGRAKVNAIIDSAVDKLSGTASQLETIFSQLDVPTDAEIISDLEQFADSLDDKANKLDAKLEAAYKKAINIATDLSQKVDEEVTNVLKSPEAFKSILYVYKAKKKLQTIYDRPHIDYSEKISVLENVKQIVTVVKDVNALAKLYIFINLPVNKDKLNIHKNPKKDALLLNHNTSSWQRLVDHIRGHAFDRLLKKARINQQQCTAILAGQEVNPAIDDPVKTYEILKSYEKEPIFCQHHSNKNLFNLFHSTNTSGKIAKLINYCKSISEKDPKLKGRIRH